MGQERSLALAASGARSSPNRIYPGSGLDSQDSIQSGAGFVAAGQNAGASPNLIGNASEFGTNNSDNDISELPSEPGSKCGSPTQSPPKDVQRTVVGTKRGRSWRAKPSVAVPDSETAMASGSADEDWISDEESDLDSDFGSDSSTNSDIGFQIDSGVPRENFNSYALELGHDFRAAREGLVLSVDERLQRWKVSARYMVPPEYRIPPRKRARTCENKPRSIYLETEDPDDPSLVLIQPFDGYFHLACPFYVSDPARHQSCVIEHELKSIKKLVGHLRKHHAEPPYCPWCGLTFDRLLQRDQHIRGVSCQDRRPISIGGVNDYQQAKLVKYDSPSSREDERWLRVYATVFPEAAKPRHSAAYLTTGVGLSVSLVRDYWAARGRECIHEYLSSRGLLNLGWSGEERALAALRHLVLEDLIQKCLAEDAALSGDGQ